MKRRMCGECQHIRSSGDGFYCSKLSQLEGFTAEVDANDDPDCALWEAEEYCDE